MPQNFPLVSVIIVNHNGIEFVDACLRSVLNNNYPYFEVIFVDNASEDKSLEYVKKTFGSDTRLRFIENKASLGPAVGRNKGIAAAKGSYAAFLDNDTVVDKDWLSELVKVFDSDPAIGAAQSKLLRIEQRDFFDSTGDYLTPLGFLSERARGAKDTGQFDYVCDIFSAKSASSIVRKEVLDRIGAFDEDYYMYLEETDLCWRVWLSGYRVVFIPGSVVYHAYGTKKKAKAEYYPAYVVRYYGCRNYIATLIKNLGTLSLLKILPFHILSWSCLALMFMLKARLKDAMWIIKASLWNAVNIRALLQKRSVIQKKIRVIKDSRLMPKIMVSKSLAYYLGKSVSYIYGRAY